MINLQNQQTENKKAIANKNIEIKSDDISDVGQTNKWSTEEEKLKIEKLIIDNDGTKYLSDDGTYSELSSTIDSLTDVEITNLQEGEVLVYNNSVSKWVNMMIDSKTVEEGW